MDGFGADGGQRGQQGGGRAGATTGGAGAQGAQCPDGVCDEEDVLVFRVRTRGEERPVAQGEDSGALQQNRRVDVIREDALPGSARIVGKFQIDLPGGGLIWATEDPTLGQPILNVQAGSTVPFEGGRIVEPLRFHGYTNYASFIDRLEVTLYRGDDMDRVTPLATIYLGTRQVNLREVRNVRTPAGVGKPRCDWASTTLRPLSLSSLRCSPRSARRIWIQPSSMARTTPP